MTLLQKDASISLAVLAAHINLTTTPCWKRVQRLERDGYITKRVALVSPEKLNLKFTALVTARTDGLSSEQLKKFTTEAPALAHVLDFYRLEAKGEYVLRVVAADREAFDAFLAHLTDDMQVKDMTVQYVAQALKNTTAYPVPAALVRK